MLDILIRQVVNKNNYITIIKKSGERIENVLLHNYDPQKSVSGKFGKKEIEIKIPYEDIKDIEFQDGYKT